MSTKQRNRRVLGMGLIAVALVVGEAAVKEAGAPTTAASAPGAEPSVATPTPRPSAPLRADKSAPDEGVVSPEIAELLQMADAGIPGPVIQCYVQNSTASYSPKSGEIIALVRHGISSETLVAMLERGKQSWERRILAGNLVGNAPASALGSNHYAQPAVVVYVLPPQSPMLAAGYPVGYLNSAYGPRYRYYPSPASSAGYYSGGPVPAVYRPSLPGRSVSPGASNRSALAQNLAEMGSNSRRQNAPGEPPAFNEQTKPMETIARQKLAAWEATGLTPDQAQQAVAALKQAQEERQRQADRQAALVQDNVRLQARLAAYENPEQDPVMREGLKGQVMAVDSKWGFVVLNVGAEQGALERGVLLVEHGGQYVSKVRLTRVHRQQSIANVIPESKQTEIREGDRVFY